MTDDWTGQPLSARGRRAILALLAEPSVEAAAKAAPLRACRLTLADLPPDWIAFARPRGLVQGLRDGDRLTADQEPTAQRPMAASDSSMLGAALGAARGRR